jgi:outer membrane receptor protein involved in Fe transport
MEEMKKQMLNWAFPAVVSVLLLFSAPAMAEVFNIPAGPLGQAVNAYAETTGQELIYMNTLLAGKSSPGVRGDLSREKALDAILKGTGVTFVETDRDTVVLKAEDGAAADNPSPEGRAPSAPDAKFHMGSLVVTGEKMDRSLQDTVTAVTVLTSGDVGSGSNLNIEDIYGKIPNVINSSMGGASVRGVDGAGATLGSVSFVTGARPKVSTRIDGVTEHWAGYTFLQSSLWDVQQVEVLRGPQSTTQGRNTIGGALVLKTNDPSFQMESAFRSGLKSSEGNQVYQLAGMVSGPLVEDNLAGRLTLESLTGNGFIAYGTEGTDGGGNAYEWPWDPSEIENLNIKGKLLFTPRSVPELSVLTTLSRRTAKGEYLNYVTGVTDEELKRYELITPIHNTRYQDSDVNALVLETAWDMEDASFYLEYAYSDYVASFEQYASELDMDLDEKDHELETRMVYEPGAGRLKGVAGLYYYHRDKNLLVPGAFTVRQDEITTYAAYADAVVAVTDNLDLIFGGRVENEGQKRDVMAWRTRFVTDTDETLFLPKLGANWKLGEQSSVGLLVRKGYSPGGASIDFVSEDYYEYGKEEVTTWEVTGRTGFLNDQSFLSATFFYNFYDDYQAYTENRDDFQNTVFGAINIKEVETYGIEVEATARVTSRLTLFGSVGLLDSEVTDSYEYYEKLVGNELGFAPDLNLAFGFTHQLTDNWSWGADASHVGSYYAYVENDEIQADSPKSKTSGDYTVVNMTVGYTGHDGNFSVRGYVNNLFDELVVLKHWDDEAQVGEPLNFGMVLDLKF